VSTKVDKNPLVGEPTPSGGRRDKRSVAAPVTGWYKGGTGNGGGSRLTMERLLLHDGVEQKVDADKELSTSEPTRDGVHKVEFGSTACE
jgi:hypothetical protein